MEKYVLFKNRDQDFAIDVSKVERIIEFQEPKEIPESLDYLLGVIKYEESILPVIDLNIRLYGRKIQNTKDTKIIVVAWKSRQMGLLVDNIIGIKNFEEEHYEQSNIDINISKKYIDGFIKLEDSIVIVLDIDSILNEEKEQELLEDIAEHEIEEQDLLEDIGEHEIEEQELLEDISEHEIEEQDLEGQAEYAN